MTKIFCGSNLFQGKTALKSGTLVEFEVTGGRLRPVVQEVRAVSLIDFVAPVDEDASEWDAELMRDEFFIF